MTFIGVYDRWMAHLAEIANLANRIPDGAARMEAATGPDAFMLREADPVQRDVILMPVPLALTFPADTEVGWAWFRLIKAAQDETPIGTLPIKEA